MALFLLFLFSRLLLADDTVVITADRIKTDLHKSTSNIILLDNKTISEANAQTLPELLRDNSDIHIANGSIFLRGTDSSHVLIILDGVPLNDPSNPNRSFDISRLSLNNIKNVQILKGAQGLLYGANAIGGVILLTSHTQATTHTTGSSFLSYGTYQTINFGVNAQKKIDIHQLSIGAEYFGTKGFSAANSLQNLNADADGEKRSTLNLHLISDFNSHQSTELSLRYNHSLLDLDNCGGPGCDDLINQLTNEELFSHIQFNQIWDNELNETHFYFNRGKYSHLNHSSTSNSLNKGEINSFGINHSNFFTDNFTQNINFEFAKETNQLQQSNENTSLFVYHKYDKGNWISNFGTRVDHNKIFGDHFTYKAAVANQLSPAQLLRLAYSTGFTAPGLYQYLDPVYGNSSLRPEKSYTLDLGHEWTTGSTQLHTTFFMTKIYDRFTYIAVLKKTINTGVSYINGLEESFNTNFSKTSMTLLTFKLLRRPQTLLKNTFFYHELSFESEYIGNRLDYNELGNIVNTPAYFISHLNYSYNDYFLKIKNIFNTEYEEVYGYGTGGRIITVGIKKSF